MCDQKAPRQVRAALTSVLSLAVCQHKFRSQLNMICSIEQVAPTIWTSNHTHKTPFIVVRECKTGRTSNGMHLATGSLSCICSQPSWE